MREGAAACAHCGDERAHRGQTSGAPAPAGRVGWLSVVPACGKQRRGAREPPRRKPTVRGSRRCHLHGLSAGDAACTGCSTSPCA